MLLFLLLNEVHSIKRENIRIPPGGKIHRCSREGRTKREVYPLVADPNEKCWSVMDNAGVDSAYFPFATAHRLESNELEVLSKFLYFSYSNKPMWISVSFHLKIMLA